MTNNEIQRERNLLNHAFSNNQGIHHHFLNDCYHLQVELEEIRKQLYESKAKANMLQAENDSLRGVIQELQAINESVDPNLIFGNKRKKNNVSLLKFNNVYNNDPYFRPNRNKRRKTNKNNVSLLNFNIVNENDPYFNTGNNFFKFNGNGNFKLPTDLKKNKTKKKRTRKKK